MHRLNPDDYEIRRTSEGLGVDLNQGQPCATRSDQRIQVAGSGAVEALSCDLDDSGHVDLVLANASEGSIDRDQGSFVFLATPDGLPYEPSLKLPTTRAHGACCADLNHDGRLDLVFCGFDNPDLIFFYGTDQGLDPAHPKRLRLEHDGVVYKEPRWIYLADGNGALWESISEE